MLAERKHLTLQFVDIMTSLYAKHKQSAQSVSHVVNFMGP